MTSYLLAAIAALVLALGGTSWLLKQSYETNGEQAAKVTELSVALEGVAKERKISEAVLTRRAAKNAAAAREAASLRQQLDDALRANQEWADQPVPKEVQDALAK